MNGTTTHSMGDRILIRADGGAEIGIGHVMRCLALSQAWQDEGGTVRFAMAAPSPAMVDRLRAEAVDVVTIASPPGSLEDAAETIELARRIAAAWVVLDGYHIGDGYQKAIHDAGLHLLAVDDYGHAAYYWADLVLNQDLNAAEPLYRRREPSTRLLLGTQYALLRREFRRFPRPRREPRPTVRRLLITMGGSDPHNMTRRVIEALALARLETAEVVILVGPGNPHATELAAAADRSPVAIRLLHNPANIPEIMAESDLAVTAGGSTVWELARYAVPSIVVIVAENQRPSSQALADRGACLLMDEVEASPPALAAAIRRLADNMQERLQLGQRMGSLVDGEGAPRVCGEMEKTAADTADRPASGLASRSARSDRTTAENG